MGRQISFFATPKDLSGVEAEVRRSRPLLLLTALSESPEPGIVEGMCVNAMGRESLRLYMVRPSDKLAVVTRQLRSGRGWAVDEPRSPVVELDRSYFDGERLSKGRVYYEPGYYSSERQWIEKSPAFIKWADGIFRTVRKVLLRDAGLNAYLGKEAADWRERTGAQQTRMQDALVRGG